jgi:hypothetical protein
MAVLMASAAHAADLPAPFVGTWGTAASLFEGTEEQMFVYLAADGLGAVVGSGSVAANATADARNARPVIGFPVRAQADGKALTLRVHEPGRPVPPDGPTLHCSRDDAAHTLTCTGPDGVAKVLRFQSATLPPETEKELAAVRAAKR